MSRISRGWKGGGDGERKLAKRQTSALAGETFPRVAIKADATSFSLYACYNASFDETSFLHQTSGGGGVAKAVSLRFSVSREFSCSFALSVLSYSSLFYILHLLLLFSFLFFFSLYSVPPPPPPPHSLPSLLLIPHLPPHSVSSVTPCHVMNMNASS